MNQDAQFNFCKSRHLPGLTVLKASMDGFTYDRHAHEEHAFGVTLQGRQDFFSGGEFHRSPPGRVIHLSPGEVHDGHSGGDQPLNYVMTYIHPRHLQPLIASAKRVQRASDVSMRETLMHDPVLRRLIGELARLVIHGVGSRIEQEHVLFQIARRVAQRAGRLEPEATARRVDSLLMQAIDYIHNHVRDDIALQDISEAAHLSKYHFLRLFRTQFGITPHQYVMSCRINAARADIEAGASPQDVTFHYGFADLSHFNRRFKRIYGMTPHQYQQNVHR